MPYENSDDGILETRGSAKFDSVIAEENVTAARAKHQGLPDSGEVFTKGDLEPPKIGPNQQFYTYMSYKGSMTDRQKVDRLKKKSKDYNLKGCTFTPRINQTVPKKVMQAKPS